VKYLLLTAFVYVALWVINLLYGNFFLIVLQGLIGAGLFVVLAVYLNTLDDDNLTRHLEFQQKIERLSKEIEELKKQNMVSSG
jgi:tRNA(Phe) wybutosine-synthesizing methylase Tyw3